MNDYIGKICPFCKTAFQPGDDIVVCSDCDMPHHKDCWIENQGCTTFGCLGTIKAVDHAATSVTATHMIFEDTGSEVFCTRCGAQNTRSSSFCARCGNKLTVPQPVPLPPVRPQAAAMDGDVRQLVGVNTEYYLPKFRMLKARNQAASWNWPAFLVPAYWMMYRKMYGYAAAVLAVDIILAIIGSTVLSLLALGGYIALGILGNFIYMKYVESKANRARTMYGPEKYQFITANGGVNVTATVLTVVGRAVLALILVL